MTWEPMATTTSTPMPKNQDQSGPADVEACVEVSNPNQCAADTMPLEDHSAGDDVLDNEEPIEPRIEEGKKEDVTPPSPWGCIENKEAWMADFKQVCEEGVKRVMDEFRDKIRNNDVTEGRPDNEDNDCLEDVKNWAVKQKQSMINN